MEFFYTLLNYLAFVLGVLSGLYGSYRIPEAVAGSKDDISGKDIFAKFAFYVYVQEVLVAHFAIATHFYVSAGMATVIYALIIFTVPAIGYSLGKQKFKS